jgi:hypothetical protein
MRQQFPYYLLNLRVQKTVLRGILHAQRTIHNALILFNKLTGRFQSEHSPLYEKVLGYSWRKNHETPQNKLWPGRDSNPLDQPVWFSVLLCQSISTVQQVLS